MKLSEALASLLLVAASGGAGAFTPHQKTTTSWNRATSTRIMMSSLSPPPSEGGSRIPAKKVLTAEDVVGKANAQGTLPGKDGKEEYPKLFTQEIYDDFQSALLKLEKRVKEGPGTLSAAEIDAFQGETGRIVEEMKQYLKNPEARKDEIARTYGAAGIPSVAEKVETPKVTASAPAQTIPPPVAAAPQPAVAPVALNPAPVTPAPVTTSSPPASGYGITDLSLDEGPAFDGTGIGLAKGTTNTYAIPGMDEMSPEEYRNKLQETISARQAKRREESLKSRGGKIGNANAQSYLDSLSNKGENVIAAVDVTLSSSSSSSVQKSHAVNEDLNERRVADEIIAKTEMEESDEVNIVDVENDDTEELDEAPLDVEEQRIQDETQNIPQLFSEENQSKLKSVLTKIEKSKAEKDRIRMSEWQVKNSPDAMSEKSDDVKTAEENERYSLGQSSGYFIRNDDTRRQNPILGMDPSKRYAQVHDRTGSTTQRPVSARVESVFDRNSVGAIRKSPLKSQTTAQSLAKTEMDQIQRPTPGSESPNYQTVIGRTTVGDLRKNKPQSAVPLTVSLVESERRLRPTPGTELPNYHKIEDRRSVGDMRKSASKLLSSNPSISSLVGSEKRQRPTPRTQSLTQSATDVKTFVGDLRKSSNKPFVASSARTSLAQKEKRTRPAPSSDLPAHSQVRDRRSVGDFRDPATKKSLSSPTSLVENEARQRPAPSTSSKDKGVIDSRGVVFKTTSSISSANAAASLITDEVRQRPTASTSSRDKDVIDSRGVVFKSSPSKSQFQPVSSLIADEVRQRPVVSQGSKDISASDSRGVVFKSSPSKSQFQPVSSLIADEVRQRPVVSQGSKDISASDSRGVVFKSSPSTLKSQPISSLIADEVRQRPTASTSSKDKDVSDSRGVVFKSSSSNPELQPSSSLIADEVRQRPIVSRSKQSPTDSRGVVFKTAPSSSTAPLATSLIAGEQRQRTTASTSLRKFDRVQDRTGDARVAAKKPFPQPPPPRPLFVNKQTRPPRASADPRKYTRIENRVGPDIRRPVKEKTTAAEASGEESHWWNEKTQRPRSIPFKQPEALERDSQTQSAQARKSHMKEEKRRREQESFQVPIAELQPSSLKALVKEERQEEEEKHANLPPLKMLLTSDRPIAGVKELPQKPVAKESQLKSLLKDEAKNDLSKKRQKRPPNAGDEWWNEKPMRPEGYVKHSQPINTSYENRGNHLRDYGDVVSQPGNEGDAHDEDVP